MKRLKRIEIDGQKKPFEVWEMTVAQVLEFAQREDLFSELSLKDFVRLAEELLPEFTNATVDDLKKLAPSEIRELWEGFKEVNSDFFDVARAVGLTGLLEHLQRAIISDFSKLLASLLSLDTPESGSTDTPSSATH